MKNYNSIFHIIPHGTTFILILLCASIAFSSCYRDHAEEQEVYESTLPGLCSGPRNGLHYNYANGIIDAVGQKLGFGMRNVATSGSLENAKLLFNDENEPTCNMAIIHEDTVYTAGQMAVPNEDIQLMKVASKTDNIMVLFKEDVHLLVNKNLVTDIWNDADNAPVPPSPPDGLTMNDLVKSPSTRKINLGTINSNTYITAKIILGTYTFTKDPIYSTEAFSAAVAKVNNGTYHAMFYVAPAPVSEITSLGDSPNVQLLQARLNGKQFMYDNNGKIPGDTYAFMTSDLNDNLAVRAILATNGTLNNDFNVKLLVTPGNYFEIKYISDFLNYVYTMPAEYSQLYCPKWSSLSALDSLVYFNSSESGWNYSSAAYFASFSQINYTLGEFSSGPTGSTNDAIVDDILTVLSSSMNAQLTETNPTGSLENAISVVNGESAMAIVQDDIYYYLHEKNDSYEKLKTVSMEKVMPLYYEDVHILVNTASVTDYWHDANNEPGADGLITMNDLVKRDVSWKINVGEKTSGTFLTAVNLLLTYSFTDTPTYSFESPSTAVGKVSDGTYDAVFYVAAAPVAEITAIGSDPNVMLIQAALGPYSGDLSYETGTIDAGTYLFQGTTVANNIRTRALIVMSPAFNDRNIGNFINAIYEKNAAGQLTSTTRWSEVTLPEALEYFKEHPMGWSDKAADYFINNMVFTK